MPHIVIKAIAGQPQDKLQEMAEKIADVVSTTLGVPAKFVSASLEEYPRKEWEGVYNEYIKDKGNVLVKPGYSNPVTFE